MLNITSVRYMLNDLWTAVQPMGECVCCLRTEPVASNPNKRTEGYCESCLSDRLVVLKAVEENVRDKARSLLSVAFG